MATWNEISDEIRQARDGHEQVRHKYLRKFQEHRGGRNTIAYYSGFLHNGKHRGSVGIEDRDQYAFMSLSMGARKAEESPTGKAREGVIHDNGLDLILHTGGGKIEAAESIMEFLFTLYRGDVEVFVPHMAMSAGTIMACGAKAIHMGTYSSLGPIDPQTEDGIPVWSILKDFDEAKKDIAKSKSNYLAWQTMLSSYPLGIISACNVLNELSVAIATRWLQRDNGMFGELDSDTRDKKAEDIVKALSDYSNLKSHSRHLSIDTCRNVIGFGEKIVDLAGDGTLEYDTMKSALLSYHKACEQTLRDKKKVSKFIENHVGQVIYVSDELQQRERTAMGTVNSLEAFEQETLELIDSKDEDN